MISNTDLEESHGILHHKV